MTRKDYVAFAELVCQIEPRFDWDGVDGDPFVDLVSGMADVFEVDNPRFDRGRFYVACGQVVAS